MIGQHPTPPEIVQRMLDLAEVDTTLAVEGRILDPGCGEGAFIGAVLRRAVWFAQERALPLSWVLARVRGVELDPKAATACRALCKSILVEGGFKPADSHLDRLVVVEDFLSFRESGWDIVLSNPPYVRLEGLGEEQRAMIRKKFRSAVNRFDLYFAFFEQALGLVKPRGVVCFISPQKFMQVWSGSGLRGVLAEQHVKLIQLLNEEAFPGLITYPAITVIRKEAPPKDGVLVVEDERNGARRVVPAARLGKEPWNEAFGHRRDASELTLADVTERIGVGIATGADAAFVITPEWADKIPMENTRVWVGGRQLPKREGAKIDKSERIVWPYDENANLLPLNTIPEVIRFLKRPEAYQRLHERTCVQGGKPWWAFHERPRPADFARPKILLQDIQEEPEFHLDFEGTIPKHSVYYLIPRAGVDIHRLADYLNGAEAGSWLRQHCQPAAGGRLRLQTWVLRGLPVPPALAKSRQARLQTR